MNLYDRYRAKARRNSLGLSVPQLAALIDTSATTVYRYEDGARKPDLLTFVRMAHHLRIPVSSLIEQAAQECRTFDSEGRNVMVAAIHVAEAMRAAEPGSERSLMTSSQAREAAREDRTNHSL
ncbi:helix-turn-helix domain-containing protein [Streptomyces sp. x-19]|uniref:helix-turn-helix domain-containing protein n=1 Tax=Streptomyces sp. x-19 TaxID=2789280 RepID=UPI00398032EA